MTSSKQITSKGKQLYYSLKPSLEKKFESSQYIAIEVESESYFVGDSALEALHKAKEKFPQKQFYLSQIGKAAGILK